MTAAAHTPPATPDLMLLRHNSSGGRRARLPPQPAASLLMASKGALVGGDCVEINPHASVSSPGKQKQRRVLLTAAGMQPYCKLHTPFPTAQFTVLL